MSHFKPQMRRLFLSLTTATLLLNLSIAEAVPFSTNLQVNGSSTFNDGWSQGFNGAEGSFGIVSDGTSTDSAFAIDSTVTGDNPVSGALTSINDGVGFTADSSGSDIVFDNDTYVASALISKINLTNTSTNSVFEVVLSLDYSHFVDADVGVSATNPYGDAYIYSGLELSKRGSPNELFYNAIWSDTSDNFLPIGDYNSTTGTLGTFGAGISEDGTSLFSFILNPSDFIELEMVFTMEGDDLDFSTPFESHITSSLSIASVVETAVPAPATLFLLAGGLMLLPIQRRLRSTR